MSSLSPPPLRPTALSLLHLLLLGTLALATAASTEDSSTTTAAPPTSAPTPTPRSRPYGQRPLSPAEAARCEDELETLRDLHLRYAVARTVKGFSLAVYKPHGDVGDFASSELLRIGAWDGPTAARALDFAAAAAARAPADGRGRECLTPPCHEHVAVDVGTGVGWWAFSAAAKGWKVVAVEAAPTNVALLRLSLCLNPELAPLVYLKEAMVGGSGHDACAIAMPENNVGDGEVVCDGPDGKPSAWTEEDMQDYRDLPHPHKIERIFRVPVTALSEILDDAWERDAKTPHHATLLKLDVEGSEYAALNGTLRWLKKGRLPVVYSEVWRNVRGGVQDFLGVFHRFGYQVCHCCFVERFECRKRDTSKHTYIQQLKHESCLNPVPIEPGMGVMQFSRVMEHFTSVCATLPQQP